MARSPDAPARALVIDSDPALVALLREWLAERDCSVAAGEAAGADGYDLIVVDLPFPRQGGRQRLEQLARRHPHTPIIALSPGFLPGIHSAGALARELGVARVLAVPVTRDKLLEAVSRLLERAP